ncbi:MAG: glycosyltransferase family 4 protein [Mesorhizobium sp.]
MSPAASREQRFNRLQHELTAWGTDLAHAHLLDAADLARLSARGFRSLVTVHNTRAGFPQGLAELPAEQAVLLVGCARAVELELHAARLPIPLRTVWNGIRIQAPASRASNDGWRARLGLASDALVLLALANPRPQKRLHLLPSILAATRVRSGRDVKLIVAGAASPRNQPAQLALSVLQSEIERFGVGEHVHLVGLVDDVQGLLAAADALVSPSEHEGLSLAHLEALAANVPVVASGDGGTSELAAEFATLRQVPLDSAPDVFAHAIVELTEAHGVAVKKDIIYRCRTPSRAISIDILCLSYR